MPYQRTAKLPFPLCILIILKEYEGFHLTVEKGRIKMNLFVLNCNQLTIALKKVSCG